MNISKISWLSFAFFYLLFLQSAVYSQYSGWTVYKTSNSGIPSNLVDLVSIDNNGNKWLTFYNFTGLAKYDDTTWTFYNTTNSGLTSNRINSITTDQTGNIWIGTGSMWGDTSGGLVKYDGTNWTVYNTSNSGLPINVVGAIAIDSGGIMWMGTGGDMAMGGAGLVKYDGTNWTVYDSSNSGLPHLRVMSIAIDEKGNKWIGMDGGGVVKYNDTAWTIYNSSTPGAPVSRINSLAIDRSGNKWFGTGHKYLCSGYNGLIKYNDTTWTVYNSSNPGFTPEPVQSIAIERNGTKWVAIGCQSAEQVGELAKYDDTNWILYRRSNSGLPDNRVTSVAIDRHGNKWIGTYGGGLARFSDQIFITSPNGGEIIKALSQKDITWTNNSLENIKIDYTTNNGTTWINIITSTPATSGSYTWTVPHTLSTQCKVRLSDVNDSTVFSKSNSTFSIISPLSITSPISGQNWQALSQQNITWSSNNVENVKIEYSTNNGTSWIEIVSSTPAPTGSYTWTIPNTPSTQCKIRLSSVLNNNITNLSNTFSITPALSITSPNGGQIWQVLSQKNITWSNINVIQNIKIEYTPNNGTNWNEIISSTPASSGSYPWIIPNTPSTQCKVRLSDVTNNTIFAQSSGVFTISAYPISAKISADSIWFDTNFNGIETKQVNADSSNGLKLNYDWYVKNVLVAQGINPSITLSTGDNWLKLKVTDSLNQIAYDSVRIKVYCARSKTNGGIYSGVTQIGNLFYVTSIDKGVYSFDSSGTLPMPFMTGGSIQSTMSISSKNLLYVGSDDTRLYCFDVQLNSIWDKSMGGIIKSSPSITSDGNTIYIGTNNGYLKALDANNGNPKWTFNANGGIISSPTIVELVDSNLNIIEKIIYFGTENGVFFALKDKETNYENYWSKTTIPDSAIISSPAISSEGIIYFGSKNGNIYRVKWDGTYQPDWNKNTGGKIASSPVIGKNDIVYVANSNGYIYGYEKEFTSGSAPLKQFDIQSGVNGTPSIGADGNLYLGFNNGKFYKLEDTDGVTDLAIKWYLSANGGIEGPVLATENGIIVVGCTNGDIYIMKDPATKTEVTENLSLSWPTFKGNNKRNKVTQISTSTTGISDISQIPTSFDLSQNYPNPFNPSTVINYQIPVTSYITLKVFDMIGNEIASLVNEEKPAGYHTVTFEAGKLASGVYMYQLTAGDFSVTKKLILTK